MLVRRRIDDDDDIIAERGPTPADRATSCGSSPPRRKSVFAARNRGSVEQLNGRLQDTDVRIARPETLSRLGLAAITWRAVTAQCLGDDRAAATPTSCCHVGAKFEDMPIWMQHATPPDIARVRVVMGFVSSECW